MNSEQKTAIENIYDLYDNDQTIKQKNIEQFMIEWDKHSALQEVRRFWDGIPIGFEITSVGKALGQSNARRCASELPKIR